MTNTNCLAGIKCPGCDWEESFRIEITTMMVMTDEGSGEHEDVQWDDDSYIECLECGHGGVVQSFRKANDV